METTPIMDPVENILAIVDERIDARFRLQEIVMREQITATVNEAVDRAMASAMITLNETIASSIAEAMEKQKNSNDDLQCSVGVCDFVWAFRRFWLPVCPKAWTKFD